MPLSVTIRDIRRESGTWYIRVGKEEYEIPGGLAALKRFVRDRVDRISKLDLACMAIAAQLKTDPDFASPESLFGVQSTMTIGGKDVD
jgi:hypothetical protein